eukprot:Hpha_TRINITY_DN7570_c0_g2::TRINITY_DN7570_c0_g2_i1::g.18894::m.18894/K04958/ITPR1; inositol 1,4,5-triphosphate receptor type 1
MGRSTHGPAGAAASRRPASSMRRRSFTPAELDRDLDDASLQSMSPTALPPPRGSIISRLFGWLNFIGLLRKKVTRIRNFIFSEPIDPRETHSLAVAQTCILSPLFYYQGAMVGLGILGVIRSRLWLSWHLLCIVRSSHSLHNVIRAVTQNGRALLLTALLGVIVVYLFSVGAYVFFSESMVHKVEGQADQQVCRTLASCFSYTLTNGVRSGGGIGDLMNDPSLGSPRYPWQMMLEFFFYVIVVVFLLNIVFGIIVDTFAELRAHKEIVEEDIRSKCFICGLDASEFERHAAGFQHHTTNDHNMWSYVHFLHYLRIKDESDFTGQESYVCDRMRRMDLSFFPLNKALSLDQKLKHETGEDIDGETGELLERIDATEERLADEMTHTSKEVTDMRGQLTEMSRHIRGVLSLVEMQAASRPQESSHDGSPGAGSKQRASPTNTRESLSGFAAGGQSFHLPPLTSGFSFAGGRSFVV